LGRRGVVLFLYSTTLQIIQTPKPTALYLNSPLVSTKVWMEDANILKKAMPLLSLQNHVKIRVVEQYVTPPISCSDELLLQ
jgi:hypothetical protein